MYYDEVCILYSIINSDDPNEIIHSIFHYHSKISMNVQCYSYKPCKN